MKKYIVSHGDEVRRR